MMADLPRSFVNAVTSFQLENTQWIIVIAILALIVCWLTENSKWRH